METHYLCPKCKSHLRIRENVILTFKCKEHGEKGIILLNSKLGNYSFTIHHQAELCPEPGHKIDFYCPVCFENLKATEINENLVKILMIDADNIEYEIFFSSIIGEHSTFKIEKNNIIEKFGDDTSSYMNYFTSKLNQELNK